MSMPGKVTALLIEDSAFMRIKIADILRGCNRIELIATAMNGKDGVEKALQYKPDVIITDMVMPEYDGLYVVKNIMKKIPTPIILLSALDKSDTMVFDALHEGAVDFFMKPSALDRESASSNDLQDLVIHVARKDTSTVKDLSRNTHQHTFENLYDLIAIGASTGGPAAIEYIITHLPSNLPIPVVIAQHMPSHFINAFAQRLNALAPIKVAVARTGDVLQGGTIYILSGESNGRLSRDTDGRFVMAETSDRYTDYNNPSIDCLFESVADVCGERSIGVLLTGMGKDGARGLKKIKDRGAVTVAQDEQSSVVFGMPKAALDFGAVNRTMALRSIPGFVVSCL